MPNISTNHAVTYTTLNRITETVICFGRKIQFKVALFKRGISRKNAFLKVIIVKTKKNVVERC